MRQMIGAISRLFILEIGTPPSCCRYRGLTRLAITTSECFLSPFLSLSLSFPFHSNVLAICELNNVTMPDDHEKHPSPPHSSF